MPRRAKVRGQRGLDRAGFDRAAAAARRQRTTPRCTSYHERYNQSENHRCYSSGSRPRCKPVEFAWFEYQGQDLPPVDLARMNSNPILAGSYPDPSICRAGDDYFMVNSTFAWYPGITDFRSKDLVNWTQIGHVLDRPSQLNLDGLGVSEGIFAATIQHHGGLFYVVTTLIGCPGKPCRTFYVTASDPSGPWSEPRDLDDVDGIDPSFFFDDGENAGRATSHITAPAAGSAAYPGHRASGCTSSTCRPGRRHPGTGRIIVNGGSDLAKQPIWIEGPHLFKRDGFYYLAQAEGGTGWSIRR